MNDPKPLRIAAVGDLHYSRQSKGAARDLFTQASEQADVLVLCGDLTDYGLPEEAHALAEDIHGACRIPAIGVFGNHDYESGKLEELRTILEGAGVRILDGDCTEVGDVGFVGVCGFGGGFGARMLNGWGEPAIKNFVQEAVDQALRLERGLARLTTSRKVALLHYAPIRATVAGEDPEIFAFLGSTRLEGPLNRFEVNVVFHGHAHGGAPTGATSSGIPVHNVSMAVRKRAEPDKPPFLLYTV